MRHATSIPGDGVLVRPLALLEIEQIVPIYLDAFRGMTNRLLIEEWMRCNLQAFPQKLCFGAWCDTCLVGYAVWTEKGGFRAASVWELEQIAVLAQYRRQGVGTTLVRESLMQIKNHLKNRTASLKLVTVTTGADNESRRLYERVLGAKPECIIRDLYEGDEQVLIARFGRGNGS